MKFETVRIYFLSDFSFCCHQKILLPWQREVRFISAVISSYLKTALIGFDGCCESVLIASYFNTLTKE